MGECEGSAWSGASREGASDSLSGADSEYEFFNGLLPVSGKDDVGGLGKPELLESALGHASDIADPPTPPPPHAGIPRVARGFRWPQSEKGFLIFGSLQLW